MMEAGKTYSVAVRELTAEYAPELTDHWEDIIHKVEEAVSMFDCVRRPSAP